MIPAPSESKPWGREATKDDVYALAPKLRAADIREIRALGLTPEDGLMASWKACPQRYSIVSSGEIIGMFGVGPSHHMSERLGQPVGSVWMLGSDDLKRVKIGFLRSCHEWLEVLHRDYTILWNWADARNNLHLRWLEWLGFKIIGTAPIGVKGELFHQFLRVK